MSNVLGLMVRAVQVLRRCLEFGTSHFTHNGHLEVSRCRSESHCDDVRESDKRLHHVTFEASADDQRGCVFTAVFNFSILDAVGLCKTGTAQHLMFQASE